MDDEQRQPTSHPSRRDESSPQPALESAASYLAASAAADGEDHGGRTEFAASFEAIVRWGEANKIIRPQKDFPFFERTPTGYGNEHQCWFDEASNRWYKATYPNRFGLAWGRDGSATVGEYFTRLVLQNEYFGDDIQLVALADCGQKLRIITSQPHIVGERATYDEIRLWFRGLGFSRFESNGSIAWYRQGDNLLVSDAHEGNVIRSVTGALFAIDLNLMKPNQEIRAIIIAMLELL
jgi:hypothetical protein